MLIPFMGYVEAGYPSPALDYGEEPIEVNLMEMLIKRPSATFFLRANGDSMSGIGILPNAILIVDRSIRAKHRSIVVVVVNGELTCKRLHMKEGGKRWLMPENPRHKPFEILDGMAFKVWGVVTGVVIDKLA